ncbi:GLPGLI family protein [Frigoriflavimonas asaccharolytica]|uniref:GLPGLI family protein n=1 Tax=Frigoriflavimonas asaccharolytica TaxID=2735899 RepID=A0A8J8G8L7_9FLAO|nr:GLPGLI family protein [Frigoriflavimonas asaccharolytica]NRS92705.1 GLPGLI family protein [Frigoriflavimonas asaccharolytica]
MRIITLLTIFLFSFSSAQSSIIIYNRIINFDNDTNNIISDYKALVFEKNHSFYFNIYDRGDEILKFLKENNNIIKSTNVVFNNNEYLKIKDNSFSKEILFYKDLNQNYNWKITSEIKNILGFKCKKALGEFRGRKFEAWFTSEIPTNYGPYKFRGLPGTILSISDTEKMYVFEAIKIIKNIQPNINVESKLSFKFPLGLDEYLTYKEYIDLNNTYLNERRSRILSSLPSGAVVQETSKNHEFDLEKSFEWEKEPEKP